MKDSVEEVESPVWEGEPPPAIDNLCSLFGLSSFERSLLLLCAAVELDSEAARLCATVQGKQNSPYPTFELALAILPKAHWSAIVPASPLRLFRLVEVLNSPSSPLTACPLRLEERVLHYLTGISYSEPKLRGILRWIRGNSAIVESHEVLKRKILPQLHNDREKMPIIQLWGSDDASKISIAKNACAQMGLDLWLLPGELVPTRTEDMESFISIWTREAALLASGLYIVAEEVEPVAQRTVRHLTEAIPGPIFLGTRERWGVLDPRTVTLEVKKPEKAEQRKLWKVHLPTYVDSPNEREISKLTSEFNLNADSIQAAIEEASSLTNGGEELYEALWNACRSGTRPRLSQLAQQITPRAKMYDLVLPEREKQLLHEIAIHVAQRDRVYEEWGFEEKSSRGLGITTLFFGASGTGKTMAAEILANELNLDLFRIDISEVVNKYIGETEKNLRRVFDAAEDGGVILFFDEADALFGKRSEVRDSHDRYANIEISYLLQRMENYRGLAILSTNMKQALDPAFMRRIRFMIEFPFPDMKSRAEIWRRVFPSNTPIDSIDTDRLARLNIAGGNIRNIALYASFLAADEGVPVGMKHLRRAVQVEYDKLERPLTQSEVGDWA